jgi:hypothetical protein
VTPAPLLVGGDHWDAIVQGADDLRVSFGIDTVVELGEATVDQETL